MPEPKTTCDVLADIAKQIRCGKPARWNDGQHFVCDDCMNSKHAGSQPKDSIQLRDFFAGMGIAGIIHEEADWNVRAKMSYEFADAMLKARAQ